MPLPPSVSVKCTAPAYGVTGAPTVPITSSGGVSGATGAGSTVRSAVQREQPTSCQEDQAPHIG